MTTNDNGSATFGWEDGVGYDITDEASVIEHFKTGDGVDAVPADGATGDAVQSPDSTGQPVDGADRPPEEKNQEPEAGGELSAFLDEALKDFSDEKETEEKGEETEKAPESVDPKDFESLNKAFETAVGVPIKDAIEYARNFETTAQNTLDTIRASEERLSLRMQELEVKSAWMNDASRLGVDLDDLVQERLTKAAQAYDRLPDRQKAVVARSGAKGILTIWKHIEGRGQASPARNVPSGRADIANPGQDTPNIAEVAAIEDDDKYWQAMSNMYNNRQ